jgi:hypothetical protein
MTLISTLVQRVVANYESLVILILMINLQASLLYSGVSRSFSVMTLFLPIFLAKYIA